MPGRVQVLEQGARPLPAERSDHALLSVYLDELVVEMIHDGGVIRSLHDQLVLPRFANTVARLALQTGPRLFRGTADRNEVRHTLVHGESLALHQAAVEPRIGDLEVQEMLRAGESPEPADHLTLIDVRVDQRPHEVGAGAPQW